MQRVAIIGSAGRGLDAAKMSKDLFEKMVAEVNHCICSVFGLAPEKVILISGGAAHADDVAVQLFLDEKIEKKYGGIHLYLPSRWNSKKKCFNGATHKDGNTANYYHKNYSKVVYDDENFSLNRLDKIFLKQDEKDANVLFHDEPIGFLSRNTLVATDCDYMIALTFGEDEAAPHSGGGTFHTWKRCKLPQTKKIHIPISSLGKKTIARQSSIKAFFA